MKFNISVKSGDTIYLQLIIILIQRKGIHLIYQLKGVSCDAITKY